jgi:glutamate-5-semialdehyde dehydrogenase
MSDLREQILELGRQARVASRALAVASTERKNAALVAMADALLRNQPAILAANARDLAAAEQKGLTGSMLERLRLNESRVKGMAEGVRQVAQLPDPVGESLRDWTQPNGINIRKLRVPIGVIGIIYESRPNVTSDAAVLCLKTGNATILRGGSEAIESNRAIAAALQEGLEQSGLPFSAIQLVPFTDRDAVTHLAQMDQYVDCLIPRGGHSLIQRVVQEARMPVIKHYDGVCAAYVDSEADLGMAADIVFNGKVQRPSVCNALETVLVHSQVAHQFLAKAGKQLLEAGVQLRADERARQILGDNPAVVAASPEDFRTEFLDLVLAVKIIDRLDDAVEHINGHGSHHSDVIITANETRAERFLAAVDSATVYWNASTRFTDGGEFGFGAEIGISTDKLHARGPMGLEELTSYKYQIRGNGQVRG